MEGIAEMWDGWDTTVNSRSSEEVLTDLLTPAEKSNSPKKPSRQKKDPDRAFLYLQNNWDLVYKYSKKFVFFNRQKEILKLLTRHFGQYDKDPVVFFLLKKGMFSTFWYKCLYVSLVLCVGFVIHTLVMSLVLPVFSLIIVLFLLGTLLLLF